MVLRRETDVGITPKKELGLFDSVCIIVGIIIGAGIYEVTPTVAASMGSWEGTLGVWLGGGVLALTGALCYAELASAYPHEGGDYIYQQRAYGRWAGYLFGWSQLAIIRPGDIALMAFVFARYAQTLYSPHGHMRVIYAAAAVVALTAVNIVGVKEGKWTQNFLTVVKSMGLLAIIGAGLLAPGGSAPPVESSALTMQGFQLALILVLFTFGGWNEMAYVAAEVKQPNRNIMRALLTGTVFVTVLYVVVNGAFLHALGQGQMASSQAIALDTMAQIFPSRAGVLISIIICISALGSVNGLIFTGARISYAMGVEHKTFRRLGRWNPRLGTPAWSLLVQGVLSLAIVLVAGSFIDTILYTAPVVWLFFLATGFSVFVLRHKEPHFHRPYKTTGFPWTTIIFCACCTFMFYSSLSYALAVKPIGLLIVFSVLLMGAILYRFVDVALPYGTEPAGE